MASYAENVSIWWRHHEVVRSIQQLRLRISLHGPGCCKCTRMRWSRLKHYQKYTWFDCDFHIHIMMRSDNAQVGLCEGVHTQLTSMEFNDLISSSPRGCGWVIKSNGLSGDSGQRGPYSPYKPCNRSLYIGIIIFPHKDNTQSTGHN